MKYQSIVLLVLIELMMSACGTPTVNIDPTVNVPSSVAGDDPRASIAPLPVGVTMISKLTCTGQTVGFRAIPAINITFSYQEATYSDDRKQITCSLSSNVPSNNTQVSGSNSMLLQLGEPGYSTGECVVQADIDQSSGHWNFTNDKRVIYSGTAQTTMGGLLDISVYCH